VYNYKARTATLSPATRNPHRWQRNSPPRTWGRRARERL